MQSRGAHKHMLRVFHHVISATKQNWLDLIENGQVNNLMLTEQSFTVQKFAISVAGK